ncbi:MAG: TonB-dependent receptor [Pseudomonadota bacterium]
MIARCLLALIATAALTLGQCAHANPNAVTQFNLPSQRLDDALQAYAELTGLQLLYAAELTSDQSSASVIGRMSNAQALAQLLEGSNIAFRFVNDTSVALSTEGVDEGGVADSTEAGKAQSPSSNELRQPDAGADASYNTVEEIIVTAQIREERLQDIPVSGTAFLGDLIESNRLLEIDDIARFTPGLASSFFNYSSPIIAVRGANNTFSQAGAGKPVGVFIDGVFVPRYSASSFELFDLEQVTVLRGPQGTLFGRNVTGGAIQIQTLEPSFEETDVRFRLGAGNFDLIEAAGLISGPLADGVAGKVSVSYKDRGGFGFDRFNGQNLELLESLNIRSSLRFELSDTAELRLSADYATDETGGRSVSFISSNDGADLTGNDGDIRTAEIGQPQSYERDIFGLAAHLDWTVRGGEIQSITAYRTSDAREEYSLGSGNVTLPSVSTQFLKDEVDEPTSFSQELRYVSDPSDVFDFIVGLYYYQEETDRFVGDVLLGIGGNARFVDRFFNVNADTTSLAAYAQLTFHLGDQFDIGVGARYTTEDKDVTVDFVDNNNPANNFLTSPSNDFSEFTPRLTFTYRPQDNVTLFASWTEGFTAGGFNTETNNIDAIELGFEPETITAYELGAKTSWADGRVIANLTLFDQEFENKLEGFFTPAGPFFSIFNAAEATMSGAELEFSWAMTDALTASATYATLDTEYESFVIPLGADFSGNELPTSPETTYSLSLDYLKPLSNSSEISGSLTYTFQDEYFSGASNIDDFLIDDYSLINARFGYAWDGGRWQADVWAKNLTDEDFVRIRGNQGALGELYGPPRTYGISITYRGQ